jgi:hypothetical protein
MDSGTTQAEHRITKVTTPETNATGAEAAPASCRACQKASNAHSASIASPKQSPYVRVANERAHKAPIQTAYLTRCVFNNLTRQKIEAVATAQYRLSLIMNTDKEIMVGCVATMRVDNLAAPTFRDISLDNR